MRFVDELHRWCDERQDVVNVDGTVVFNYLQQREIDTTEKPQTPLEEAETTDPWSIADDWIG